MKFYYDDLEQLVTNFVLKTQKLGDTKVSKMLRNRGFIINLAIYFFFITASKLV